MVTAIRKNIGEQELVLDAPDGVVALPWGKGTRRWVHVLNYRGEAVQAKLALPDCGGRAIAVDSPDAAPPTWTLDEAGSGRLAFTLNALDVYAIVAVE